MKTREIAYIGLCTALIAVCSWISIPLTVPITLQTFAIFLTVALLGLKNGTITVLVYILLGAIGLPVFSGFKSGAAVLLGPTGGYIIGFLFSAIVVGLILKFFGKSTLVMFISMIIGLIVCYIFGTIWFMIVYMKNTGDIGLVSVLSWCVIPFIIPDIIKIILAIILYKPLSKELIK